MGLPLFGVWLEMEEEDDEEEDNDRHIAIFIIEKKKKKMMMGYACVCGIQREMEMLCYPLIPSFPFSSKYI